MDDGVEEIQSILSEACNYNNRGGATTEIDAMKGTNEKTQGDFASGVGEVEEESNSASRPRPLGCNRDAAEEGPRKDRALESEEGNTGGSGGVSIINNLISSILHPHHGAEEDEGRDKGVPGDRLPAASNTIGEVAPAAEEASLLIHSIVHD